MEQFEETVVNPNISLNNFEVKIRENEEKHVHQNMPVSNTAKKDSSNNYKAIFLLAILIGVLFYQITFIL
ncbi:MAG: hypothetical protein AB8B89_07525 [Gammaproteobacteria bacterium]